MLIALAAIVALQNATSVKDWRATAIADVTAAYREFADNHPGMKNPEDPQFPARLRAARDASLAAAKNASDPSGYRKALDVFSEGLSDGHAFVSAFGDVHSGRPLWPGFVAAWRGRNEVVFHAGPASPAPAGSVILSCDGKPVTQAIRENSRGMWFRPAEAGQWWTIGPLLFVGSSPPDATQPRRCRFRLPDGSHRDALLNWTALPDATFDLIGKAMAGERTAIGLTEPRKGIFLIGLPTFSPDEAGVRAYRTLYSDIDRRRTELLDADAVVLDLRFNNGGSSEWPLELARRLWGKAAVEARMDAYFRNVRIWWRVSPENVAAMAEREAKIRANGQADAADHEHAVGEGMKAALAAGRDYFIDVPAESSRANAPIPPTDVKTRVYVITYGGCASACLDAIDVFKRFPNVKLIGAPTSADSTYLDVRHAELPSGKGAITIPLKVWMNRPRLSGEVYRPDIPFDQLDWSTAAFLDRIKRDLKGPTAH
ncbi:MAG: S41 family peptidase [Sphingomicrobium sp.]